MSKCVSLLFLLPTFVAMRGTYDKGHSDSFGMRELNHSLPRPCWKHGKMKMEEQMRTNQCRNNNKVRIEW
jgi:hypothetical protein